MKGLISQTNEKYEEREHERYSTNWIYLMSTTIQKINFSNEVLAYEL